MVSIDHLTIQTPPDSPETLPTVTLTPHILEKIFAASMQHQGLETGEAMVGVVIPNGDLPQMYIFETVAPAQDTIREWAMFEQGDDWQRAIFNWWHDNWELMRDLRRRSYGRSMIAKWDVPLRHLGDWHKQPSGMLQPSGGDMRTAKRLMRELDLDFMLTPIVTFEDFDAGEGELPPLATSNTLAIATEARRLRIDFWWVKPRGNTFQPVQPHLEVDGALPRLPEVVWWLKTPQRMDDELAALDEAGLDVMDVLSWSADGHPPLDTCFIIYRPGSHRVWIAITAASYPYRVPTWRSAPIMRPGTDEDFFTALYAASLAVPASALPAWSADMHLQDAIAHIESWEKTRA